MRKHRRSVFRLIRRTSATLRLWGRQKEEGDEGRGLEERTRVTGGGEEMGGRVRERERRGRGKEGCD